MNRAVEAAAAGPFMLECIADTGDTLLAGLGPMGCVLSFRSATSEPPYLVSVGDSDAQGYVTYLYEDEPTEIPARHAIPWSLANEALREFFLRSAMVDTVVWEEV